ncbi:MAG: hypothetical protein ACP5KA_06960, partial [Desulfurococcaceae archaeon]
GVSGEEDTQAKHIHIIDSPVPSSLDNATQLSLGTPPPRTSSSSLTPVETLTKPSQPMIPKPRSGFVNSR